MGDRTGGGSKLNLGSGKTFWRKRPSHQAVEAAGVCPRAGLGQGNDKARGVQAQPGCYPSDMGTAIIAPAPAVAMVA